MKRLAFVITLGITTLMMGSSSSAQQIPGRGFSALLCLVQEVGTPGNAQISIVITEDTGASARVTITHGTSGSSHLVVYQDANETGHLDCGDLIISVT